MYIERVPNRNSPPAYLIRESFRDEGKVKKRTLANLSKLPMDLIESIRVLLKEGNSLLESPRFELLQSLPHGHVDASALARIGRGVLGKTRPPWAL